MFKFKFSKATFRDRQMEFGEGTLTTGSLKRPNVFLE